MMVPFSFFIFIFFLLGIILLVAGIATKSKVLQLVPIAPFAIALGLLLLVIIALGRM